MSKQTNKSVRVAVLAMFTALVIVLQFMSYFIKIGTFNLSLVLIPIVLAAVLFGQNYAAALGAVFGVTVVAASVTGLDAGGNILFNSSPVLTSAVCILKGAAAGYSAGLVSRLLKSKSSLASITAAAATVPVVNTGIFTACMLLFFKGTLTSWANGTDLVYYTVFGLVGLNFIIELIINLVAAPAILTAAEAIKKIRR